MKRLILAFSVLATVACAQTAPVLTASFALNTNGVVIAPTNFWSANNVLTTTSNDLRFVNATGDVLTGELAVPGLVASYTNRVTIRPGLNLFQFWTFTNSIIGGAVPTGGSASYDTELADQLYVFDGTNSFRTYMLAPGPTWLNNATLLGATTATDVISFEHFAYYLSRASTNWQMATPDSLGTGYENWFLALGQYGNYYTLDYQTQMRANWLWSMYAQGSLVDLITGTNGVQASRSGRSFVVSLSGSNALTGPVRVDATNLTIRIGSRRVIGTNVVETGLAWNETNAATLAWVVVTNGTTNAATVYHSGNFSPGSYLSQSAWAGAQTGLLAFVGAPTSYNAAGSARQVSYGAMNGTNYWFFYSGTNWERIAVGARPW